MSQRQLTLGLRLGDYATFDNFHGGRNAGVAQQLSALSRDQNAPVVVLCGAENTGKSHLLQAVCHAVEQHSDSVMCLSMAELTLASPGILEGLEQHSLVAIDDLDSVAGKTEWEEALFHLYNRILDCGHRLLVTLSDTPAQVPFALEDLVSRLSHGVLLQLGLYRDEDYLTILRARAEQRGLAMNDDVASYILRRAPRKLGELLAILDRLDDNSLRAQRGLTVPFVRAVMNW
ncbi:MAG: DnaA regulatory inactivator Hda [Oleiphilaceae bacterium]|nr:DnaA regulatory inactivator Hda [Oleiphilaceae bacterium]